MFFMRLFLCALLLYLDFVSAQTVCNGRSQYCDRLYSNITQICAHDSAFVGSLPQDNQDQSVTSQLNAGVRFLQAQSHLDIFKTLSLCHTSCWLEDAGSVSSYLSSIKSWLDSNPSEVVTLLLTNGDNVDVSMFDEAFSSSGLKSYAYTPPSSPLALDSWPTIGTLISSGTRLVAFLDYGAKPASVPYILDEFTYFFETPYDTTDPSFPECTIDRPPNSSPDGKMYIVNHFLDLKIGGIEIPDNAADPVTNAATGTGSIGAQVGLCEGLYGRAPVAILLDFFDKGDAFTAQDNANHL